ncbi:MAG: hypothetical protein M3Q80_00930 [bacterium]|nr:hypothetical protein [bacterium]
MARFLEITKDGNTHFVGPVKGGRKTIDLENAVQRCIKNSKVTNISVGHVDTVPAGHRAVLPQNLRTLFATA